MRVDAALLALGLLVMQPGLADTDHASRLHGLFDEHFRWRMHEFPEDALERGDYSQADRLNDISLAAIERRQGDTRAFLERLGAIDRAALPDDDRVNYDLFERALSEEVEGHRFRAFLVAVSGRWGPQQTVPQLHVRARFASTADYDNYLKRLEAVPRVAADTIELLRTGLAEGRTAPRVTMSGVPEQFDRLQSGGLDELGAPLRNFPPSVPEADRQRLRQRFAEVSLPAVKAALGELGAFVEREYVPGCRASIAASAFPDGEAYYAFQLRSMTTTNLSAREIHETGLREVARIRGEMLEVIRRTDFSAQRPEAAGLQGDALLAAFLSYLRTDPRFYYTNADELVRGYRDICKRIDAELPRLFRTLPRLPYGVRCIPEFMAPSQTTAYYSRGDIRNGQPGYYYVNTYALNQRPKYEMVALSLHEAVPGHHFQIALAQELEHVPEFRKDAWYTAFGEGWALYAERLGLEMGLFGDPYDDFGRLTYEMWRACRLVVDPGMHALGWTRERAVRFMLDNTALSEVNIHAEIDRYIAWPGQATAYKLGELRIRELRQRAESRLGPRFDLREFHDVLLLAGTLPLDVLERRVDDWIARRNVSGGG